MLEQLLEIDNKEMQILNGVISDSTVFWHGAQPNLPFINGDNDYTLRALNVN